MVEGEGVPLGDWERGVLEGEGVGDWEGVGEGVREGEGVGVGVALGEGLGDCEGEGEGEQEGRLTCPGEVHTSGQGQVRQVALEEAPVVVE